MLTATYAETRGVIDQIQHLIQTEIAPCSHYTNPNGRKRDEMETEIIPTDESSNNNIPSTTIFVVTDSLQTISACKKNVLTLRDLLRSDTKDITSQVYFMQQLAKEFNTTLRFIHQRGHTIGSNPDKQQPTPLVKLQDICDKFAKIASQEGRSREPFCVSPLKHLTGLEWIVLNGTSIDDAEVELADYYKSLFWQQQSYYMYKACHNPFPSILKDTLLGLHNIATTAQAIVSNKIPATSYTLLVCQNLGIQPKYLQSFAKEQQQFANSVSGGYHIKGSTPT
jgi:hypothetical protein